MTSPPPSAVATRSSSASRSHPTPTCSTSPNASATRSPTSRRTCPNGITGEIVYDGTKFITSSINEVVKTLVESLLIVAVVIFLFLGSLRAVAIPLIAMPLSLIGTFFVMLMLGYSVNLLTLLALVLAIGLVVDDAIIVVENVDRHMKEGKSPMQAALIAARELGGPIIAMTIVLVAVYVPIGFQGGLDRRAVHRICVHACRRGHSVGHRRADAVADDDLAHLQAGAGRRPLREVRRSTSSSDCTAATSGCLHGTLNTWQVPVVMGVILLGWSWSTVQDLEVGTRAAGGPGRRAGADRRPGQRDVASR